MVAQESASTVTGLVITESGEPVPRASVVLRSAEGRRRPEYGTLTAADGTFALWEIMPGRYSLEVEKDGFVNYEYGRRHARGRGAVLEFPSFGIQLELEIPLISTASISGRVFDEIGNLLIGARVSAYTQQFQEGSLTLVRVSGADRSFARTNDLGEYRLYGLTPGGYRVNAQYSLQVVAPGKRLRVDQSNQTSGYAPTFFPGTIDPGAAAPIEAAPGMEVRGVDIVMTPVPITDVRGQIVGCTYESPEDVNISLVYDLPQSRNLRVQYFGRVLDLDGSFEFTKVTAGSYMLSILDRNRNRSWTEVPIEVGVEDIDNLVVACAEPVLVEGRIRVEGESDGLLDADQEMDVSFRPFTGNGTGYGTVVRRDGTFIGRNFPPRRFRISVGPLPGNMFVKSARLGSRDLLDEGITFQGHMSGIEIVLSDQAASVKGTAGDSDQQPMSNVQVVLVPERRLRHRADLYETTYTNDRGQFSLAGIAPGYYELFAWEWLEGRSYQDPAFLNRYLNEGTSIELQPKGRISAITLQTLPPGGP